MESILGCALCLPLPFLHHSNFYELFLLLIYTKPVDVSIVSPKKVLTVVFMQFCYCKL